MLYKIAEALKVNSLNFVSVVPGSAEDIMQTFFWLDEDNRNALNLFQLVPSVNNDDKGINDTTAMYKASDYWPVTPPVGIWFNYGIVDDFMHDWMEKKEELRKGEITEEEYFEWKICWPNNYDNS